MTKTQLLEELSKLIDEMQNIRAWGSLELDFRDGAPNFVRKTITKKLRDDAHEVNRAARTYQR